MYSSPLIKVITESIIGPNCFRAMILDYTSEELAKVDIIFCELLNDKHQVGERQVIKVSLSPNGLKELSQKVERVLHLL